MSVALKLEPVEVVPVSLIARYLQVFITRTVNQFATNYTWPTCSMTPASDRLRRLSDNVTPKSHRYHGNGKMKRERIDRFSRMVRRDFVVNRNSEMNRLNVIFVLCSSAERVDFIAKVSDSKELNAHIWILSFPSFSRRCFHKSMPIVVIANNGVKWSLVVGIQQEERLSFRHLSLFEPSW